MTTHDLKILPRFFDAVVRGDKTFEIRSTQDRKFAVGDRLWLREWDPTPKPDDLKTAVGYTGRVTRQMVTYVTDWEQQRGTVVMGIAPTDDPTVFPVGIIIDMLRHADENPDSRYAADVPRLVADTRYWMARCSLLERVSREVFDVAETDGERFAVPRHKLNVLSRVVTGRDVDETP